MTFKIPATDVNKADLPRGKAFLVVALGPELYCAGLRQGGKVLLAAADGEVEAVLTGAPSIGPLADFHNQQMFGRPMHYATKDGVDPLGLFDSVERVNPKDKLAVDPRKVYSAATVTVAGDPNLPV